jgi:Fic family protein
MSSDEPDKKADIDSPEDRGEPVGLMEPMVVSEDRRARASLNDLAIELAQRSASFKARLPVGMAPALAALVRSMNCYYSNLIEGHATHPIDIERALNSDYSVEVGKRNLQLEARAHIAVQCWIDEGGMTGSPYRLETIRTLHTRFYDEMPDALRRVEDPASGKLIEVVPGELRRRDVQVGRHVAISPGAMPRFLARFEEAYARLGKSDAIVAAAAAHHRLLWIHPFLDGNGRVVRLTSHASLSQLLDTGALWSVSRGLARAVQDYKAHLAACDTPRRGDRDGRGTLSEEALTQFTTFFLRTCLDQVAFMEGLMQPERLRARIQLWAEEEIRLGGLPAKSGAILDALLYRGVLNRGDVAGLLDVEGRQARRLTAPLFEKGIVASDSTRAPIRLAFPAALASRLMPGLFPDKVD